MVQYTRLPFIRPYDFVDMATGSAPTTIQYTLVPTSISISISIISISISISIINIQRVKYEVSYSVYYYFSKKVITVLILVYSMDTEMHLASPHLSSAVTPVVCTHFEVQPVQLLVGVAAGSADVANYNCMLLLAAAERLLLL